MPTTHRITRAVIPVAGLGTRCLPVTKTIPKTLLPIVDRPVLEFVLEEAVASGLEDVLIVTAPGQDAIAGHLDDAPELERRLAGSDRVAPLERLRAITGRCRLFYAHQTEPRGLGDAIRVARDHVEGKPFAVLLGDTIIEGRPDGPPPLRHMLDVSEQRGVSVIAVHRAPEDDLRHYGVIDGEADPEMPGVLRIRSVVEKPKPAQAPSNLAIAGRYVLAPEILDELDDLARNEHDDLSLTDALNHLARGGSLLAMEIDARRFDVGNRIDYARCFLDFALRRPDTAGPVRRHLMTLLQENTAHDWTHVD